MQTQIIRIDPRRLKLLDLNARYMRHETFKRLTDNIVHDGALTSVPFCWQVYDDASQTPQFDEQGDPMLEVLSGNHRVKGAIAAGLTEIEVMITQDYLSPDERVAIQLSHNSLTGEDDPTTLKNLYMSIQEPTMRLYTGFDDKSLGLLGEVKIGGLAEANLTFQTIALVFLPTELEEVSATWDAAKKELAGTKVAWLASMADYDRALDALADVGAAHGIRNVATCLMIVLDVFSRHLEELAQGWYDAETGQPVKDARRVPVASLLNSDRIGSKSAATVRRALDQIVKRGEAATLEEALARLAESYFAAGKLNTWGLNMKEPEKTHD